MDHKLRVTDLTTFLSGEMRSLVGILHRERCSLVLRDAAGQVRTFSKPGVRDLEHLLDHEPEMLRGALIADKVIGKAAAGMAAYGGVRAVYADVLSRRAIPLLEANGIPYAYAALCERIIRPEGDTRCPLEQIVEPAFTAAEVVSLLRDHFAAMQAERKKIGKK